MGILNIFAHFATMKQGFVTYFSSFRFSRQLLVIVVGAGVLLLAQCKNKTGGNEGGLSKVDSLADKYTKGSEVIAQLSKDIAAEPNNPELYYKRARQWAQENNPIKALADIEKALQMSPSNPLYHFTMGEISFMADSISDAMNAFKKAVELKADYTDALVKLGELQMVLFQYDESIATFDRILQANPNSATGYYYMGRNYAGKKDTVKALINYKKAVSLDNDYFDAHAQLGNIYYARQYEKNKEIAHLELAIDYYTNAIRINDVSAEAYFNRGQAYYAHSSFKASSLEKALRDYERVMAINPDDYRPHIEIGLINFNLDRYEEALENIDNGLAMNPNFVYGYYLRGLVNMQKGDKPKAVEDFRTVLKMDPKYTIARDFLKQLGEK